MKSVKEINIVDYVNALAMLSCRFIQARNINKKVSIHHLDDMLISGGFTLAYGEYIAPQFKQVEVSLRAELKAGDNEARGAFIDETAERCEIIAKAFIELEQEIEQEKKQSTPLVENIGGLVVRSHLIRHEYIKIVALHGAVLESVLDVYLDFVELFNNLCKRYGRSEPLKNPLGLVKVNEEQLILGKLSFNKDASYTQPKSTPDTFATILTTLSDSERERIIERIKGIIAPGTSPKNIALILVALKQMQLLTLSNISLLARVWYNEFGYRAALKSLENGLSNHISGDHTKFERANKASIEVYKNQLQE